MSECRADVSAANEVSYTCAFDTYGISVKSWLQLLSQICTICGQDGWNPIQLYKSLGSDSELFEYLWRFQELLTRLEVNCGIGVINLHVQRIPPPID